MALPNETSLAIMLKNNKSRGQGSLNAVRSESKVPLTVAIHLNLIFRVRKQKGK